MNRCDEQPVWLGPCSVGGRVRDAYIAFGPFVSPSALIIQGDGLCESASGGEPVSPQNQLCVTACQKKRPFDHAAASEALTRQRPGLT